MEHSEDVIDALCSDVKVTFLKTIKKINVQKYSTRELRKINDEVKTNCSGESILHRALKYNTPATFAFFKSIAEKDPELLKEQRDCKIKGFEGQSPLHVAIVKEYTTRVVEILKIAKVNEMTQALLCIPATGDKFKNTVLIGQLPLSVAALSCKNEDFKIIRILLHNHARMWLKNEHGDTVFHSLIKYADDYPEKMEHIKPTFKFLWKHFSEFCESRKKRKKYMKITDILFWENNSGLTPLELSAKLGVSEIFQILIDIKDVYYFTDTKDGLFDVREYDVTEFDRLIGYLENLENEGKLPILEILFDHRCSQHELFQILNIWLPEYVLEKKWMAYKCTLLMWMIVHVLFMLVFTASSITKSQIFFCSENNETSCDINVIILYIIAFIYFATGVIYLCLAGLCIKRLTERCSSKFGNPRKFGSMRHNLDYIVCLLLIAIGALMECVLLPLKIHFDYYLAIALISGWYFMLYFSPLFKGLVSFTFMIRSGFLKDFVPFSAISMCFMSPFTSVMYMLFHGTDNVEEFDNFLSSLFTMFNLGVGLDNIDVLNKSRIPGLAYSIFVAFTILSFIILFNALIAVMTNTFSDVHNNRNSYLAYSRLGMIELFEDIVLFKRLRIFKFLVKKAKYWTRSDDVEPSPIYKRYIKKCKQQRASHQHQNDITQIENESDMTLKSKTRYYSLTQLLEDFDDFSDDKNEKKINAKMNFKNLPQFLHNHIRKSRGLKKVYPDKEITLHVYQAHKSSQIPDSKTQ